MHPNTSCIHLLFNLKPNKNFLSYLIVATLILHLANILLILLKKKLHKTVYYLLLNLSISDILLVVLLIVALKCATDETLNYFYGLRSAFFTASVLFTSGITLERYIRVSLFCPCSNSALKSLQIFALMLTYENRLLCIIRMAKLTNA